MNGHGSIRILPNIISLVRLLSVPVMVYLILLEGYEWAFWLFVAAGLSDAVDGAIAKYFDAVTEFGKYLDPLADKALLIGSYVALGYQGQLPLWLVILVVFRDLIIIGGAMLYQTLTQSLSMQPLFVSKINTVLQIVLAACLLAELGLLIPVGPAIGVLTIAVAATTFVSGAVYMVEWGKRSVANGRGRR